MPRKGHQTGAKGCPPELLHHEHRHGIRLSAAKLTRVHRQLARTDPAVAAHLRRRIREPARFDALMEGRTRYTSDTPCGKCGSTTRTVYTAACWTCAIDRRPLQRDSTGKVTGWPLALRSRAGWLAVRDEVRRERAGERDFISFGPFTAGTTPTGKLSLHAPSLALEIPDLAALSFDYINNLSRRHAEVREVLAWAGWI